MIYTVDQIRSLTAPIAEAYGVKRLSLFGSYARGEATDASDVDLLVDRGEIRSGFIMGGLYIDLRDALNKELDMVSTHGASPEFLSRIRKDEIKLYERT